MVLLVHHPDAMLEGMSNRVRPAPAAGSVLPNDPELPLARVHPIHEVVQVDYFLPGCPPSAEAIWAFATALLEGRAPRLAPGQIRFD